MRFQIKMLFRRFDSKNYINALTKKYILIFGTKKETLTVHNSSETYSGLKMWKNKKFFCTTKVRLFNGVCCRKQAGWLCRLLNAFRSNFWVSQESLHIFLPAFSPPPSVDILYENFGPRRDKEQKISSSIIEKTYWFFFHLLNDDTRKECHRFNWKKFYIGRIILMNRSCHCHILSIKLIGVHLHCIKSPLANVLTAFEKTSLNRTTIKQF